MNVNRKRSMGRRRASSRKRKSDALESAEELRPNPGVGARGEGVDCISSLPNEVLGEIISLLPTNEGAQLKSFLAVGAPSGAPRLLTSTSVMWGMWGCADVRSLLITYHPSLIPTEALAAACTHGRATVRNMTLWKNV